MSDARLSDHGEGLDRRQVTLDNPALIAIQEAIRHFCDEGNHQHLRVSSTCFRIELSKDTSDVIVDRSRTRGENFANFSIPLALNYPVQDLALPGRDTNLP